MLAAPSLLAVGRQAIFGQIVRRLVPQLQQHHAQVTLATRRGLATKPVSEPHTDATHAKHASTHASHSTETTHANKATSASGSKKGGAKKSTATAGRKAKAKAAGAGASKREAAARVTAARSEKRRATQLKKAEARTRARERASEKRTAKRERHIAQVQKRKAAAKALRERRAASRQKVAEKTRERTLARRTRAQAREERIKKIARERYERLLAYNEKHPVRAHRDPNLPKRPITVYSAWVKQHFNQVRADAEKKASGKVSLGEISRELASQWKAVSAETKAKLELEYARERAAYETAMAKREKTAAPKRPLTPYIQFFVANHARLQREHPDTKMSALMPLIAAEYKKVPAAERTAAKEKYDRELAAWQTESEKWKSAHPQLAQQEHTRRQRARPSLAAITEEVRVALERQSETDRRRRASKTNDKGPQADKKPRARATKKTTNTAKKTDEPKH